MAGAGTCRGEDGRRGYDSRLGNSFIRRLKIDTYLGEIYRSMVFELVVGKKRRQPKSSLGFGKVHNLAVIFR